MHSLVLKCAALTLKARPRDLLQGRLVVISAQREKDLEAFPRINNHNRI